MHTFLNKMRLYFILGRTFGISLPLCNLISSVSRRLFHKTPSFIAEKKNRIIRNVIADIVESESFKNINKTIPPRKIESQNHRIWTLWFQGEENAPELVKCCINSMRKHLDEVCVLHTDNIEDYIGAYPESIQKHIDSGAITLTHLSDYIRFTLLSLYGGIWLDSTIYCNNALPEYAYNLPFYTYREREYININNANSWWKAYVLGCSEPSEMFALAQRILIAYWNQYDVLVDYYLVDHILSYCLSLPEFNEYKIQIPENTRNIYWLLQNSNTPWSPEVQEKIPYISKLDYKILSLDKVKYNSCLYQLLYRYRN